MHLLLSEHLKQALVALLAELGLLGGVVKKGLQMLGDLGVVAAIGEQAGLVMENHFGVAADAGGDDGQTSPHGFEEGDGDTFAEAGEKEDIGDGQQLGDIFADAQEAEAGCDLQFFCEGLDAGAFLAVADEKQKGMLIGGRGLEMIADMFPCVDGTSVILDGVKPRDLHDDGLMGGDV